MNISGLSLSGAIAGDSIRGGVSFSGFTYLSPNVGKGIGVTASLANGLPSIVDTTGKPVYGYAFSPTSNLLSGDITARPVTVTNVSVRDKIYDGTRSVILQGVGFSGLVTGETLSLIPIESSPKANGRNRV